VKHLYIAGKWTAAADAGTAQSVNPFDGSVLEMLAEAGPADVALAVAAAREAFDDGPWRRTTSGERVALLTKVADLLQRDKEELARIESLDTGKTLNEARFDVDDSTAVFRNYAGRFAGGRVVDPSRADVTSTIVHEPVGVCALITPWNYPLLQISWKLAPALAAGNTAVVKPSEVTPLSTVFLVGLLEEAGLPPGVVNLLLGSGASCGSSLVADPRVDMISFTGGLATGERIMALAARGVRRVALELGGKNPNIVFADTDFETVVDNALTAAFLHSGQVCSAGARLIVQDSLYPSFVAELAARAARIRLGSGLDPATECGPLVSAAHRAKVERYIAVTLDEGATLLAGGSRPSSGDLADGFFLHPTVFGDCDRTMTAVREEVFGPVVTVERFSTEEEAIFLGNDTAYGLAGAVWTSDASRAARVAAALRHGTVWINDYHPYLPQAEWGGFGRSGIGRELGPSGLLEYQEIKHIYHNARPGPARWFASSEQ
jgi:betaine-aldehyde dehydrogenase